MGMQALVAVRTAMLCEEGSVPVPVAETHAWILDTHLSQPSARIGERLELRGVLLRMGMRQVIDPRRRIGEASFDLSPGLGLARFFDLVGISWKGSFSRLRSCPMVAKSIVLALYSTSIIWNSSAEMTSCSIKTSAM